jgi:excisionase family DNA binding protein
MAQATNIPAKVLTVRELSEYLRVHPSTVYRLLRQRQLPAFRVGSDWRFNVEAIDRWRASMEAGAQIFEQPTTPSRKGNA